MKKQISTSILLLIVYFLIGHIASVQAAKYDYDVPYINQLQSANSGFGESACAPTSIAMLIRYYYENSPIDVPEIYHAGIQGYKYQGPAKGYKNVSFQLPDTGLEIVEQEFRQYYTGNYSGLRDPDIAAKYLESVWEGESYGGSATFEEVITKIKQRPLILNIKWDNQYGHYVVLRGYDDKDSPDKNDDIFYVNDPYTAWGYTPKGWSCPIAGSGKKCEVDYQTLKAWYENHYQRIITFKPKLTAEQRAYTVIVDNGNVEINKDAIDNTAELVWWEYYKNGNWYYPKEGGHSARWTPDLMVDGYYKVESIFRKDQTQDAVDYSIYNSQGNLLDEINVNQKGDGEWSTVDLGTFFLQKGSYIEIEDVPANVNIDAIRFTYMGHKYTVTMSEIDDLAELYINGILIYKGRWGWVGFEPDWQYLGKYPGYTGLFEITSHLMAGPNELRFKLWDQVAGGSSLAWWVYKNQVLEDSDYIWWLPFDGPGYKYNKSITIQMIDTVGGYCHLCNYPYPVFSGYGAPYDLLNASHETVIKTKCNTNNTVNTVDVKVGTGNQFHYIYKLGYIYKKAWVPINLTGTGALLYKYWYSGSASATGVTVSDMDTTNYLVAYICTWTGTQWKCGCHDKNCAKNFWQLQMFKGSKSSVNTAPTTSIKKSFETYVAEAPTTSIPPPPPPPPLDLDADFTANPTSGPAPLTVQFTDKSTGVIASWLWDFGDGETSTELNPSHTYRDPGIYTVSLTLTGPEGSETETKNDYICVEGTYFRDADRDGYGNPNSTTQACSPPSGYVENNLDCDDTDSSIHPNASEVCNGKDDDCDGGIDEGVKNTYYRDADGDGYGDPTNSTQACSQPSGYAIDSTDCDDTDPVEHPNQTWYKDFDNDGYSDGTVDTTSCTRPAGYKIVSELTYISGDCNDTDSSIHPGATESCNGKDDDCNGEVDDGLPKTTYYRDADGDGYGDASETLEACAQPPGYVTNATDCDDNDPNQYPGAQEICNGEDDDCDDEIDESCIYSFDIEPAQGTIGTELTINGWGCGDKKGKVTVGTSKCKVLEWTNTSIICLLPKVSSTTKVGTNDLTIKRKGKGIEPIVMEDAFSIMAPKIKNISPYSGVAKDEITITGSFFGMNKVKVYMDDGIRKKPKKCKVTSLTMDSETGESTLKVLVPKGLNSGMCDVTVVNKVGSDTVDDVFTVD